MVSFISRPARNGGQYGRLKIEDYSGSEEFMMFGQTYINFHNFGVPGTPIVITGKYERRFQNSELRFNIISIRLMSQVAGQLVHSITINLPRDKATDNFRQVLAEHAASADGGGADASQNLGALYLNLYDPSINRSVRLSAARRIPINRRLVELLEGENIQFSVN